MRGHWRRFALQVAIGVGMLAINAISEDLYIAVVAVALVVAPAIVWTVFGVLLWLSRQAPDIESLSEAVDDMMTLGLASTVGAAIGVVALLLVLDVLTAPAGSLVSVGLGYIVVAVAIPAVFKLPVVRDVWLPAIRRRQERDAK